MVGEVTAPRPQGICLPGVTAPHHACWSCNFGEDTDFGLSERRIQARIEEYEMLVEMAEAMPALAKTMLWYQTWRVRKGPDSSLYGLAGRVVHDLWFHRLTRPVKVRVNGSVDVWAWNHVGVEEAIDYWNENKNRPLR